MNADGARVAWELLGAPAWPPAAGKAGPAGPCWLCGSVVAEGEGWRLRDFLTPTFTNHTLAAAPASGQWHCQPIARWLVDEVWAVIAGMGLPYNPAYDEMAAVGIRRDEQRIGALPLAPGWVLERVWPGMYRDLVGRYGPRW